jgi:DNA ligase (NAD+)
LYYTAEPIISDKEYDELFQILSVREEKYPDFICPNSPTQKMNIQVQDIFQKKEHGEHRLLSLKNSYVAADLRDRDVFLQRQLPD